LILIADLLAAEWGVRLLARQSKVVSLRRSVAVCRSESEALRPAARFVPLRPRRRPACFCG